MKIRVVAVVVILLLALIGCKRNTPQQNPYPLVQMDSLLLAPENYVNRKVTVEGTIIHVCPVDGRKMKLRSENGAIIKVIPEKEAERFDKSLDHKRVEVMGVVKVSYITAEYVDSLAQQKTVLCHIDNTPCTDSAWIAERKKENVADQLSKEQTDGLRQKMEEKKSDRVAVVTIVASSVKEVQP